MRTDLPKLVRILPLKSRVTRWGQRTAYDILAFADEEKFSKFNGNELQYFCAVGKT
jgi:hypothetical protein